MFISKVTKQTKFVNILLASNVIVENNYKFFKNTRILQKKRKREMQFSRFTDIITYDYTSFFGWCWNSDLIFARRRIEENIELHPSIILIVHSENTPSTADRLVKETSCSWKLDCDVTMEARLCIDGRSGHGWATQDHWHFSLMLAEAVL